MEYNAPATLNAITFNAASGDTYLLDPDACSGLDQAPLRAPVDDRPQTAGGIVFPFLRGPRRVTLGGTLVVRSGTTEAAAVTARNTLESALIAALQAIEAADGTFTITPTGGSAQILTVRCEIPVTFSGTFLKRFLFGLVAANPDFA